jgi:hypothetical protein
MEDNDDEFIDDKDDELSFYNNRDELMDNDEITPNEDGFMKGYTRDDDNEDAIV